MPRPVRADAVTAARWHSTATARRVRGASRGGGRETRGEELTLSPNGADGDGREGPTATSGSSTELGRYGGVEDAGVCPAGPDTIPCARRDREVRRTSPWSLSHAGRAGGDVHWLGFGIWLRKKTKLSFHRSFHHNH